MRNIICSLALAVLAVGPAVGDSMAASAADTATNAPAMVVRSYPATSSRKALLRDDRQCRAFFELFGVTWPKDSSIVYVCGVGEILVCNTPENHGKIAAVFAKMPEYPELIEVEVRFVEVAQKVLDKLGPQLAAKKAKGARYDLDDFADVGAEALERALVSRHDLCLNKSWKVVTKPGAEAVGKCVTECIYPTDFDVRPVCATNAAPAATVEPQKFTMREVGIVLDATPMLSDDGKQIDLRLNAQLVGKPEWRDYGFALPAPGGKSYELPMEQPQFPVQSFDANLVLRSGETMRVGESVSKGRDGEDRTLMIFVRAKARHVQSERP